MYGMAGPQGRATHGHQVCGLQSQLGVALEGMDHPELHPVWGAMGHQCAKRHPLAKLTMPPGHQATRPRGKNVLSALHGVATCSALGASCHVLHVFVMPYG